MKHPTAAAEARSLPCVRLAAPADAAGVRACVVSAFAHYVERIGKAPAPMLLDFEAEIRANRVWVVCGDSGIVGALVQYETDLGFYIDTVAVAPSSQGQGVGRALLEFAEREALRRGYRSLYLCTNSKMTENQALYPRLGYVEYERKNEAGYDRVFYRKELVAPTGRADPAEIANRLLCAWNARHIEAFVGLLSEDVEWYDPAMARPPARGRAAVREFSEAVLEAFPDFQYEVDAPICVAADGSRCAIAWRITATHERPLRPLGYAPTGRRASLEGVDVLDIRNGEITRIRTAFDPVSAAEQLLGMNLRPVPGTWRATFAVTAQRFLAWRARGRR